MAAHPEFTARRTTKIAVFPETKHPTYFRSIGCSAPFVLPLCAVPRAPEVRQRALPPGSAEYADGGTGTPSALLGDAHAAGTCPDLARMARD